MHPTVTRRPPLTFLYPILLRQIACAKTTPFQHDVVRQRQAGHGSATAVNGQARTYAIEANKGAAQQKGNIAQRDNSGGGSGGGGSGTALIERPVRYGVAAREAAVKSAAAGTTTEEQINLPPPTPTTIGGLLTGSSAKASESAATDKASQPSQTGDSGRKQPTPANADTTATTVSSSTPPPPQPPVVPKLYPFDTWSLVKALENGSFSQTTSITLVQTLKSHLASSLQQNNLALHPSYTSITTSKSDTQHFRTSLSDLRTTVLNTRKRAAEHLRRDRTRLAQDVEGATQRMDRELQAMKDELKELWDDRRLAVRMESKVMDGRIQDLMNAGIALKLSSAANSEVESVRWVVTRRAVIALVVCGFAIVVGLVSARRSEKKGAPEEVAARAGEEAAAAVGRVIGGAAKGGGDVSGGGAGGDEGNGERTSIMASQGGVSLG